jgi:arylsulfatase A-like enzyme
MIEVLRREVSATLWVIVGVLFLACGNALAAAPKPKPNIIYIIADDLGWKDVGYHGSDIKTPTIDKLAATGTRLEQFYAQPLCTPTRAALMTGRYPFRYGLQTAVIPASNTLGTYGLPTDEYTLAQMLKDAGYRTAIVGKWHLGHSDQKYWPKQRGFDSQYGMLIGEADYFTHEIEGVEDWYRDNEPLQEEGYSTTLFGNEAVKLIETHDKKKPLFLYLTFNAPHTPYQAPQEYLDQYGKEENPARRAYAGSITAMDDQIARVLEALDRKKMRDNTLILFMSDNGGTRNALFAGTGFDVSKAKIPPDNGPYREGKGTLYEGGTRVVSLVNWPGRIRAGATTNAFLHSVDLYPTMARIAGASTAKSKPLDGMDVWSTLSEGKPSPRTEIVYNVEPYRAAIREGDWKLVWHTNLPARVELFNVKEDPSEKNNLSAQHADKVAVLQGRLNELAAAGVKPTLLEISFKEIMHQMHLPPAFPGEELEFSQEN